MNLYKSCGQLKIFNKWALLECDDNIGRLYRSLYSLEYFYKPKIQRPLWGTHISIIRGEAVLNEYIKKQLFDLSIEYYYSPTLQSNGVHFYLPVICPILDSIRNEFALPATLVAYHLSIGNICNGTGYTEPETDFISNAT